MYRSGVNSYYVTGPKETDGRDHAPASPRDHGPSPTPPRSASTAPATSSTRRCRRAAAPVSARGRRPPGGAAPRRWVGCPRKLTCAALFCAVLSCGSFLGFAAGIPAQDVPRLAPVVNQPHDLPTGQQSSDAPGGRGSGPHGLPWQAPTLLNLQLPPPPLCPTCNSFPCICHPMRFRGVFLTISSAPSSLIPFLFCSF